jgi:hypothetical protein
VATSTGRVAKLVAMKAPNLEPRGNNPKLLHTLAPLSPLRVSRFQGAYAPGFLSNPSAVSAAAAHFLLGWLPSLTIRPASSRADSHKQCGKSL